MKFVSMNKRRTTVTKHAYQQLEPRRVLTSPVIDATAGDNVIEINQLDLNVEVVVDGTVVGSYDSTSIETLTINGNGGADQFIFNVSDLEISGSYIFVGDGEEDEIWINASSETFWEINDSGRAYINDGGEGNVVGWGFTYLRGGDNDDMFTVQEQDTTMYDHPIKQYIDAGAGDDTVTIKSNSTHDIPNFFNVDVELGPGNDHIDVTFEVGVSRASVVNVTDSGSLADLDRIDFTFIDSPASSDPTVIQIDPTEPGETFTHKIDTQGISASNRLTYVPSAFDILSIQAERNSFYFFVSGPLTIDEVILNGGGGSDLFHISASALVNDNLSINGSTGNDRLTVTGTDEADTFVIDNQSRISINGSEFTEDMDSRLVGVELFFLDGGDGDDVFTVNSAKFELLGRRGDDKFFVHDTAREGGVFEIDGGRGENTLDIQRVTAASRNVLINDDRISGAATGTIQYSSSNGTFGGTNGGITIRGLDNVNDGFLVTELEPENSLELLGGGGNDYHRIGDDVAGNVTMDGSTGRDRYVFFLNRGLSRNLRVEDSGDDGETDRINVFLSGFNDNLILKGPEVQLNQDRLSFAPTIETVEILAGRGDDRIEVRAFNGVQFLRIKGEVGNDALVVNGATGVGDIQLIGNAGNDTFNMVLAPESTFVGAIGNDGVDRFIVGSRFLADAYLNGTEGDDRYDFTPRENGRRNLLIADTGESDNDSAILRKVYSSHEIVFRGSGLSVADQLIVTTSKLDAMEVIGTTGNDTITMFAAPVARMTFDTMEGNDKFNINGTDGATLIDAYLGTGSDAARIGGLSAETTMNINFDEGNDTATVGMNLIGNNANLDRIEGMLQMDMGKGADSLYVNDASSGGANGFSINSRKLLNTSSVRSRSFSGIFFIRAELVDVTANSLPSQFLIVPSPAVRFAIDGNLPGTNQLRITGSGDGRELSKTGTFSGVWTFDSFRDIEFENVEV